MLKLPISSLRTVRPSHQGTPHCAPRLRAWSSLKCSPTSKAGAGFGKPNTYPTGRQDLLPSSPGLQGRTVRAKWNAVSLAFLGDSVWELYVRRCFFFPPKRTSEYYEKVVDDVRAESQERYLEQLLAGPILSDEEKDVIRWGNNAKISTPKRFSKSGTHGKTYRAATALECLVGFLYLTDMSRLQELMAYIGFDMHANVTATTASATDDAPLRVGP